MAKARPKPAPAGRVALSRTAIVAAAVAVVDRDGLEALTMRRLGGELGVEAMSLYHHVRSKEDLIDGIVDAVMSTLQLPPAELDWSAWVRQLAWAYRRIAIEHPEVFRLIALRPLSTGTALRPVETALDVLGRAGFDSREAVTAFQTLADYTSGFALEEIAAAGGERSPAIGALDSKEFPRLHELRHRPMKRDVAFERGLDIIIAGLAQLLNRPSEAQTTRR